MERRFSVVPVQGGGIENCAFQLQETPTPVPTLIPPLTTTNDNNTLDIVNTSSSNNYLYQPHEPKRKKSLIQLTREALPRLENYRNSKRAAKRPSLGELHGGEEVFKDPSPNNINNINNNDNTEQIDHEQHHGMKFGWIQGVFIPCLLNIFGVMLFLRLSWVVAQAGIGYSLLIIGISAVVCIITTLSLSAISTNGEVKGGGIYFIISRSLGPEFGASVGIVFAFANAVAASMNTIGFCNSLSDLLNNYNYKIIDGDVNDARVVGTVAIILMILICAIGMEWESKAQNFLIGIILIAIGDFLIGVIIGPKNDIQLAQGFVGFNTTVFENNWYEEYRQTDGVKYDFFQVFAIFFPSVTGIQAGANISGDLKDPAGAIPKGTFLALVFSMVIYAIFVVFAGAAALRDATGNVTDWQLNNLTYCAPNCYYGLYNNYQIITIMSAWEPLIYAGCFAATLSTALTNLLSVPRLIQALGTDRIYPGLIYFSKGYGKNNEPYRGYVLTLIVSVAFLLIGQLNEIAPLISNFYLASYALINFCTFHAALIKPLGWRPTFKYYNTWLSLSGFFMCVIIMFLINWKSSLITFILILGLYLIVVYRKPDVNWGSSTQAQIYKTALTTAQRLVGVGDHVKNYKPQILVLSGSPSFRPALIDFGNSITKNNSLLIVGEINKDRLSHRMRSTKINNVYSWLRINKIKAFYSLMDNVKFEAGATALLQTTGIGKLKPNVLMMGYKNDWRTCNTEELSAYFNILHTAFDHRLSVTILRLKDGLDYSKLYNDDEHNTTNIDNTLSLPLSITNTDLRSLAANDMMHADSNLNLNELNKCENAACEKKAKYRKINSAQKLFTITNTQNIIPKFAMDNMFIFKKKQNKGTIDVWWLYDDGGLTMLLPYIISTRQSWSNCKLRVFALCINKNELEQDEKKMGNLLLKFRLNYSSVKIVSISDKPKDSTIKFFNDLIKDFRTSDSIDRNQCKVSEAEIASLQNKTNRQLRLRELLLENSSDANLIVMSLPLPRKDQISAPLYMAWLEILTRDMPPYLLVRGNQQSVLTFYS